MESIKVIVVVSLVQTLSGRLSTETILQLLLMFP